MKFKVGDVVLFPIGRDWQEEDIPHVILATAPAELHARYICLAFNERGFFTLNDKHLKLCIKQGGKDANIKRNSSSIKPSKICI